MLGLNCWARQGSIVHLARLDQVRARLGLDKIRLDPSLGLIKIEPEIQDSGSTKIGVRALNPKLDKFVSTEL